MEFGKRHDFSISTRISPARPDESAHQYYSQLVPILSFLFLLTLITERPVIHLIIPLRSTLRIDLNSLLQHSLGSLAPNYNPGYSSDIRP
jgi:hypothetical protein